MVLSGCSTEFSAELGFLARFGYSVELGLSTGFGDSTEFRGSVEDDFSDMFKASTER